MLRICEIWRRNETSIRQSAISPQFCSRIKTVYLSARLPPFNRIAFEAYHYQ
jgi:hypothetical protein